MAKKYPVKILSDYPFVLKGVKEIFWDQPSPTTRVHAGALIQDHWQPCFQTVDDVLSRIHATAPTLGELLVKYPELRNADWLITNEDWNAATIYFVFLPTNDSGVEILETFGCSQAEVFCVEHLFYNYFEGELRRQLELPK